MTKRGPGRPRKPLEHGTAFMDVTEDLKAQITENRDAIDALRPNARNDGLPCPATGAAHVVESTPCEGRLVWHNRCEECGETWDTPK